MATETFEDRGPAAMEGIATGGCAVGGAVPEPFDSGEIRAALQARIDEIQRRPAPTPVSKRIQPHLTTLIRASVVASVASGVPEDEFEDLVAERTHKYANGSGDDRYRYQVQWLREINLAKSALEEMPDEGGADFNDAAVIVEHFDEGIGAAIRIQKNAERRRRRVFGRPHSMSIRRSGVRGCRSPRSRRRRTVTATSHGPPRPRSADDPPPLGGSGRKLADRPCPSGGER